MLKSKRALVSFVIALAGTDLAYRLLELQTFLGVMLVALIAAGFIKLSLISAQAAPIHEIGLGLTLGILVSGAIKLLVLKALS